MKRFAYLIVIVSLLSAGCGFNDKDDKQGDDDVHASDDDDVETDDDDELSNDDSVADDSLSNDDDITEEPIFDNFPPPLDTEPDFVVEKYYLPFYSTTFLPSCINYPRYIYDGHEAWLTVTVTITKELASQGICFPVIGYQTMPGVGIIAYVGNYIPQEYRGSVENIQKRKEYCQGGIGARLLALDLEEVFSAHPWLGPGFGIVWGEFYDDANPPFGMIDSPVSATSIYNYPSYQITRLDEERVNENPEHYEKMITHQYTKHCSPDDPFIGNGIDLILLEREYEVHYPTYDEAG